MITFGRYSSPTLVQALTAAMDHYERTQKEDARYDTGSPLADRFLLEDVKRIMADVHGSLWLAWRMLAAIADSFIWSCWGAYAVWTVL